MSSERETVNRKLSKKQHKKNFQIYWSFHIERTYWVPRANPGTSRIKFESKCSHARGLSLSQWGHSLSPGRTPALSFKPLEFRKSLSPCSKFLMVKYPFRDPWLSYLFSIKCNVPVLKLDFLLSLWWLWGNGKIQRYEMRDVLYTFLRVIWNILRKRSWLIFQGVEWINTFEF